ncbi:MAG: hypothetical protein HQL18_04540, partial [Candidatus Omnitrophica bacterium]|nr:hypothetical protein [Candidatus Omnitrophota bacterium]
MISGKTSSKDFEQALFWLSLAVIVAILSVIYSPALLYAPRGDQVAYLAEVANKKTWWDFAIATYDLNRFRFFAPGDENLFRPLLYFILGNERFFFGYNFFAWQLCGLAAHIVAVGCLLKLLFLIRPGVWAAALTGFFAIMAINTEMVSWHHVTTYMIFAALILTALTHAYRILMQGAASAWRFSLIAGLLCLSCFLYETGILFAIAFGIFLWKPAGRTFRPYVCALFALPPVFLGLSALDYILRHVVAIPLPPGSAEPLFPNILLVPLQVPLWWIYSGLFPTQNQLVFGLDRTMVNLRQPALFQPLDLSLWAIRVALAAVLLGAAIFVKGLDRDLLKKRMAFWGLTLSLIVIYTATIAFGRCLSRGTKATLSINLYYPYIFWVFGLVLTFSLVNFEKVSVWVRSKAVKGVLLAVLLALIVHNAVLVHRVTTERARFDQSIVLLLKTLDLLVKEKG